MSIKPQNAKGTRDFGPLETQRRNFIFDTVKKHFSAHGFVPIETPAVENIDVLTGKYGEEGDRLLFKILNSGDYLKKANEQELVSKDIKSLTKKISDRGLRYDLTVPFARFVAKNRNDLSFPFKRYQIQPVWRADRPQKGRFREFFQCDADVVGSESLMYEAELVKIYDEVFSRLNVNAEIKVNNRKVLFGLAEAAGIEGQFMDMTMAIDKIDKIGEEGVIKEMSDRGISKESADQVLSNLTIDNLDDLEKAFVNSPTGLKGIEELRKLHSYLDRTETKNQISFDISLARGLTYYTGCILEVVSKDVKIGSIGGGGRYADLTSTFGLKGVSGVGISFGAARIFDVMEELNLFPENIDQNLKVLLVAFDDDTHAHAFEVLSQLRAQNIPSDLYPSPTKLKKQMKYANDMNVPYVILIGSEEKKSGKLTLKNMVTGEQSNLSIVDIIESLS